MNLTLDQLIAERSIYRNLVAFSCAMDDRDWEAFEDITSENMTASLGQGEISGRANIVAFIRSFLDNCGPTQHLLGNVVIDVQGNVAKSSAYVCDMHLGNGDKSGMTFHTLGRYNDEWECIEGCWRMVRRVKDNRAVVGSMEVFAS